MGKVDEKEIKRLKGLGFINNKDGETFSARIVTKNGTLTTEQVEELIVIADMYGVSKITFTSRMGIEIPGIAYENIQYTMNDLAHAGLSVGGTGPKVRPIATCKGTVCTHGNIDTWAVSEKIHDRFYEGYRSVKLPHKFKIGVGGCPNNCIKPTLNDVGLIGLNRPDYQFDRCAGCKECSVAPKCPMRTFKVADGVAQADEEKCTKCGDCIGKCPFGVAESGKVGYAVYIGGKWGKVGRVGTKLNCILDSEAEAFELIEKVILLYKDQGQPGERLGNLIDRIGIAEVERILFSDELLKRKEEIIDA